MRGLPAFNDPNLIVGAEGFSDAGVYQLRDDLYVVQSLDFFPPLVDDPFTFGQIAAANSLSDVFAMGARPVTALNIVGFPDDQLPLEILHEILQGGADRVMQAGAVISGGHTVRDVEIKYGLSVTGVTEPDKLLTNQKAQPGDRLVLTKPLGTGFITTAFKKNQCPDDVLQSAIASMTQLNQIGRDAAHAVAAHATTDITGFGLAGHANEMAQSSKMTITLQINQLPDLPGALKLVDQGYFTRASASNRAFLEPTTAVDSDLKSGPVSSEELLRTELLYDAQTSGGLLISVSEEKAEQLVKAAEERGALAAAIVGFVGEQEEVSLKITK